jgi:prefoldin subunit 5
MTNEEMERAIDFLLKSQANLEARIAQTNEQLGSFADTQADIMRVMTRTFESQAQINESTQAAIGSMHATIGSMQAAIGSIRAAIGEFASRQSRTEDSLTRLAESQIETNRRLDALIEIVQDGRNGR